MTIHTLVVGKLQENCYVVVNKKNEAIVIGPGDEIEKILASTNFLPAELRFCFLLC